MNGLDRRLAPALVALLVLALFMLVHSLVFAPAAARYRRLLASAGTIGASIDPSLAPPPVPAAVTVFLQQNSVAPPDASRRAESGELATDLVRRVAQAADACGLTVVESTPGVANRTTGPLEVRARVRLQGRYEQAVALLDRLDRDRALYRIERMTLSGAETGTVELELALARMLVERGNGAR